jgi:hypothetical protein
MVGLQADRTAGHQLSSAAGVAGFTIARLSSFSRWRTGVGYLHHELSALANTETPGQPAFDRWHESVCLQLTGFYGDFQFTVGQAQKWVNMAIKYLFVVDRALIERHWQYCHIPIDQILLAQLRRSGHTPPPVGHAWSRLDSYPQYLDFQRWFRDEFAGAPMDNEFNLWMTTSS